MIIERTRSFRSGMVDSASSADDYPADACELIYNGRIERDNCVSAVGGSRLLSLSPATATDYGRGVIEFTRTNGTRELVKFTQTSTTTTVAYSTNSGQSWTTVATLNNTSGDWSLATMTKSGTNYLLGAVGANTMYSYSGGGSANWATVTGPTTGCKYIAVHNDRLWATTGNSTLYGSKISDFATWAAPDGLVLPVQTHDGDNITGIAQAGPVLLVFKRHSTAYVDGFGNSDIIVAAGTRGISPSVGCIAPRTFQAVGSGYVWLSERGLEFWPGSGAPTPIGEGASEYIATIARNRITNATGTGSTPTLPCSVYWPEKQEYWIAWPSSSYASTDTTAVNDEGLILNMRTGAVSKRVWNPPGNTGSRKLYPGAMCMAEVTIDDQSYVRPVVLTKAGDLLAMDYGSTEMSGSTYAVPGFTSAVLVLDAAGEAWKRGLTPLDTLALTTGATITDHSGSGNDATVSGTVTLRHDGNRWHFRMTTPSVIQIPAIDLTGTSKVTLGLRAQLVSVDPGTTGYLLRIGNSPTYSTGYHIALNDASELTVAHYGTDAGAVVRTSSVTAAWVDGDTVVSVHDKTTTAPPGNDVALYLAGSASGTPTLPAADLTNAFGNDAGDAGHYRLLQWDLVRLTVQATAVDDTERAALEAYLDDSQPPGTLHSPYTLDFRFRSRPYDFDDPAGDKWLRQVTLAAIETTDQTVTVIPLVDGEESDNWQFVDIPEASGDKPQRYTARVSERGINHQVEVRGAGGLKISAVEMRAEPLVGQY